MCLRYACGPSWIYELHHNRCRHQQMERSGYHSNRVISFVSGASAIKVLGSHLLDYANVEPLMAWVDNHWRDEGLTRSA